MKTKQKPNQYRQGDVLIELLSRTNPDPKSKERDKSLKSITLAHGEVTGHAHVLELEKAHSCDSADWWKDGDSLLINCSAPAVVTHQEHGTIALPDAASHTLKVTRQREYTPEAIRNVKD